MKFGMPRLAVIWARLAATTKSEKMAETGWGKDSRRGGRRWTEWLIALNWVMKAFSLVESGPFSVRIWNSRRLMFGWLEKKLENEADSSAQTVGCVLMRVTVQFRDSSIAASRRKGFKWPILGLGKNTTWGVSAAMLEGFNFSACEFTLHQTDLFTFQYFLTLNS